jgi:hypothetical protein
MINMKQKWEIPVTNLVRNHPMTNKILAISEIDIIPCQNVRERERETKGDHDPKSGKIKSEIP